MEHVKNLYKDSENLDVIVKGTVTGKSMNSQDEVLYQIETPCGNCFEADERCVYHDVTKPVEVPQCVIDWYEENEYNLDYNLWNYIIDWDEQEPSDFYNWFNASKKAFQTLVNMHLFGYKVKEETKYTVKITKTDQYLYCVDNDFTFVTYVRPDDNPRIYHTKEELEAGGFGEVFNSPLFEVEEVEG